MLPLTPLELAQYVHKTVTRGLGYLTRHDVPISDLVMGTMINIEVQYVCLFLLLEYQFVLEWFELVLKSGDPRYPRATGFVHVHALGQPSTLSEPSSSRTSINQPSPSAPPSSAIAVLTSFS